MKDVPSVERRRSSWRRALLIALLLGAGAFAIGRARMLASPRASASREGEDDVPRTLSAIVTTATDASGGAARERDGASILVNPAEAPVDALRRGLASDEAHARIDAVEAAVSSMAIETLDELLRFDLERDPETAPTVIHGIARLGASAGGNRRADAARTLARWLDGESKRSDAPDALGNVSNLVEALGDLGGRDAMESLVTALDRGDLALHVQTLAVVKLGELRDVRARAAVERFAVRVAAIPPGEGIDEELRVEAAEAARVALEKL